MTSIERKENRYKRRILKRQLKKFYRNESIGNLENIFNYRDMFYYGRKCCNNVRWKQSIQTFELHLLSGTAKRRKEILNHTWKQKRCVHFILRERGVIRPIDAPHITDRQVHKTFVNNVLSNIYLPYNIYDNGASQKGKGLHFAHNRLKCHLRYHFKRYGRNGYVVLIDLKKFFPTAPRDTIYKRHKEYLLNKKVCDFADLLIDMLPNDIGMPLGIETSQLEMVSITSKIDNYFKCQMSIKGFAHYMDDYYMIVESKEKAHKLLSIFKNKVEELGLHISENKTKIIPLTKKFKFCKTTFILTPTGKIITHARGDSMKRARRKLKALKRKYENKEITIKEVNEFLQSQIAYYKPHNDHIKVLRLHRMYYALFIKGCED